MYIFSVFLDFEVKLEVKLEVCEFTTSRLHLQPFWGEQHWLYHPTQKRSRLMAVNHCSHRGRIRRGGQDDRCGGCDERTQVRTAGCRHR